MAKRGRGHHEAHSSLVTLGPPLKTRQMSGWSQVQDDYAYVLTVHHDVHLSNYIGLVHLVAAYTYSNSRLQPIWLLPWIELALRPTTVES